MSLRFLVLAATAAAASTVAMAQPLPVIAPDRAGFSAEGLKRIDDFFEREIEAGRTPGAVIAIARDGRLVHYKAYGFLDKAKNQPMKVDAIFQLASMTKIMVAAGGLTLTEQGRLPLYSRVDQYLPAIGRMKVGVVSASGEVTTVEPRRPMLVHDLFRHTSGLAYGANSSHPVQKAFPAGSAPASVEFGSGDELIARLSGISLLHQPGTVWQYGLSTDVLGIVIEKVSGKRLDAFLREAVWDKVRMPDTTFEVPAEKKARIAQPFANDPLTGKPQRILNLQQPARFDCGGGCAFGTVGDYLRFGQMLIDGGAIDGRRVLSPKTIAWANSDHLGPEVRNQVAGTEPHREGYSFGVLAAAVRVHEGLAAIPGSVGDFSWNGANGTQFWADPQERLVVVVGMAAPGEIRKIHREQVIDVVYGAMSELRGPPQRRAAEPRR